MSERLDTAYHRPFYGRRPVHLVSVQPDRMRLIVQPRASDMHARYLDRGEKTCIDCHKGIAHRLPDMGAAAP